MTIYTDTWKTVVSRTLNIEAGYVNDPKDPGGETKYGISKRAYPNLDILNLNLTQAINIYFSDYWMKVGLNNLHPALASQVFDHGVNHGAESSVKMLQGILHVAPDGNVGPMTAAAASRVHFTCLIFSFLSARIKFYTNDIAQWADDGRGWTNRVAQCMSWAAEDSAPLQPAPATGA